MADTRNDASEAIDQSAEARRDMAEAAAGVAREAAVMGLEGMRRVTDRFTWAFGFAGEDSEAVARRASENLGVLAETGTVLGRGMQDVSREWLTLSQHGFQKYIEGLTKLVRCRSIQDLLAVQSELMRNNWRYMIDFSRQIAEHSIEIANEATQTIGSKPKRTGGRARKAA